MSDTIHVFEKEGLGKAPFRFIGCYESRGPIRMRDKNGQLTGVEVGSPGQPMGCCEYCGTGIAICCTIQDRDGKRFIVGNVCVNKTGDNGLINNVKVQVNKLKREKKVIKDGERIEKAKGNLDTVKELLTARNHPIITNKTLYDYVTWMFDNAGNAGMIKVSKIIEKALDSLENNG